MFVRHRWLNEGMIEDREYQRNITKTAVRENTLCVLPTGLGKTPIAALVAAERVDLGKVLFLAPTKPLVAQHKKTFEKFFKLGLRMEMATGEVNEQKRSNIYKSDVIFATPQTIRNDIKRGLLSLKDVALCIFDEAHRSVGKYAYTYIARNYISHARNQLVLALTASPGSAHSRIREIRKTLSIKRVEIRTKDDKDMIKYVQKAEQERITVTLPPYIKRIQAELEKVKKERMDSLVKMRVCDFRTTKSRLIQIQQNLGRNARGAQFRALSLIAEVIKIDHALLLLETQCLYALKKYFAKLEGEETRAAARLIKNENVKEAMRIVNVLVENGKEHPKIEKLKKIVKEELIRDKYSNIIIFAQYRNTIEKIYQIISSVKFAAPVEFIGQAKKGGKGLSQKEQIELLNEFKMGFYNILCASQVAEEGLDVVETNIVVFYEPTPSAIRKIQRAGRTARTQKGKIIILIAEGTRDEAYHWSSYRKEKSMRNAIHAIQKGQKSVSEY